MRRGDSVNAQQVANEVGVTERTVRRWIARGQLAATKVGRELVIDEEDARQLATRPSAKQLDELADLRGLRERYAELSERYDQLLAVLAGRGNAS